MISVERQNQIFKQVLSWVCEHDDEFVTCMIRATDMTPEELIELDLTDYVADVMINNSIQEQKRLKYLLNKESCCSLDKQELFELQDLLNRYGRPQY